MLLQSTNRFETDVPKAICELAPVSVDGVGLNSINGGVIVYDWPVNPEAGRGTLNVMVLPALSPEIVD
jgi:hypothetical protein